MRFRRPQRDGHRLVLPGAADRRDQTAAGGVGDDGLALALWREGAQAAEDGVGDLSIGDGVEQMPANERVGSHTQEIGASGRGISHVETWVDGQARLDGNGGR